MIFVVLGLVSNRENPKDLILSEEFLTRLHILLLTLTCLGRQGSLGSELCDHPHLYLCSHPRNKTLASGVIYYVNFITSVIEYLSLKPRYTCKSSAHFTTSSGEIWKSFISCRLCASISAIHLGGSASSFSSAAS